MRASRRRQRSRPSATAVPNGARHGSLDAGQRCRTITMPCPAQPRRDQRRGRRQSMARYLWKVSYSVEGAQGLLAEGGTSRKNTIQKLLRSVGGKLVTFDY